MKISLITDEISADPTTAIELGSQWGVNHYELRGYFSDRVPHFSNYQKNKLVETLDQYHSRIIAISPGLFKLPTPSIKKPYFPVSCIESSLYQNWESTQESIKRHLDELLPSSIEYAKELGAGIIVIFSFLRNTRTEGLPPDCVLESLRLAAELAESSGMILAIEAESGFWGDTGCALSQIIKAIDNPALKINWDPANALEAGDLPFPNGYNHIKSEIAHVHFKNACFTQDGAVNYYLKGEIDWQSQVRALAFDGYNGYISVEPHQDPKVQSTKASLDYLVNLVKSVNPVENKGI